LLPCPLYNTFSPRSTEAGLEEEFERADHSVALYRQLSTVLEALKKEFEITEFLILIIS
jgi:hypothetical protein